MIEALSIAVIVVLTEVFKYITAKIEKRNGRPMKKETKGYIVLCFAFIISFIYSALVVTGVIDQSTIDMTVQIFTGALATYEVLYKRVLVKVVTSIKK